jgi:formylglycine-generating enzyme
MKNLALVFLIFIGFQSCNTAAFRVKNGVVTSFRPWAAPNCIFINDTLMCDETEVAVIDYREYLYWVGRAYGLNSNTYKSALPDTMVGYNFSSRRQINDETQFYTAPDIREGYFSSPTYNDYPIVGITNEQAEGYTNWRSDRVLEMILIEAKLIKLHLDSDSSNHFTAARYLAGQYYNYKAPKNLSIPKYRLPTVEEWELCAQHNEGDAWGVDSMSNEIRKYRKNGQDLFQTKELFLSALQKAKQGKTGQKVEIPCSVRVRSFYPNGNGLYNMIGNVAEMTTYQGIAKGGSWFHTLSESKIKSNIIYQEPEAWLGFRNVCTWVKVN